MKRITIALHGDNLTFHTDFDTRSTITILEVCKQQHLSEATRQETTCEVIKDKEEEPKE